MPKIIENLNENIIEAAKEILKEKGFEAMSIRDIADRCKIGLGTVYNYYPSKYEIVNAMVMEDWKQSLENLEKKSGQRKDVYVDLKRLFDTLKEFVSTYHSIWMQIYMASNEKKSFGDIHKNRTAVMAELNELIKGILKRNGESPENIEFVADFIGHVFGVYCNHKDFVYADLENIIKKIL